MKKIFFILAVTVSILSLSACTTANPTKKVYAVNSVPKILNAGFSRGFENEKVSPVSEAKAGESLFMFVAVKDSGFDVTRIEVFASHDGGDEDKQTIYLNKVDGEEFIYGVDVSFKALGTWKFTFYVFDEDENQSGPFRTSLEISAK